jgi:hypothetical protein
VAEGLIFPAMLNLRSGRRICPVHRDEDTRHFATSEECTCDSMSPIRPTVLSGIWPRLT